MMQSLLGIFLILCPGGAEPPATLEQAQTLWLKGFYGESLETYAALGDADPVAVALGKSRSLSSRGDYQKAQQLLSAALKQAPKERRSAGRVGRAAPLFRTDRGRGGKLPRKPFNTPPSTRRPIGCGLGH